jgi:hypothetical protein
VPRAPDPQNLNIDSTDRDNLFFVGSTEIRDSFHRQCAVRDIDVLRRNIDVPEKMFLHKPHVALQILTLHRIVFIEIERHDVAEAQGFVTVQSDQFLIDSGRS